jgi:hypothetical protein
MLYGAESADTKVPDAALGNSKLVRPIIALEIGLTEPLEELFNDARRLLQGSRGHTQAVILIKIYEEGRGRPVGPPWGLDKQKLSEMLGYDSLTQIVIGWHREKNTPLIGELTAHLYLWSSERKHPPPHPLWTFKCGLNTPEQDGAFATNLRNPLLNKDNHLKILGGVFSLPIKKLEQALRLAIGREEKMRAMKIIKSNCFT